ncbi:MAG: hypothetical protein Tsb0020_17070 [Haliangiales bacterium]
MDASVGANAVGWGHWQRVFPRGHSGLELKWCSLVTMFAKLLPIVLAGALVCCDRSAQENTTVGVTQPQQVMEAASDGLAPSGLEPALWEDIRSYPASSVAITAFPNAQKFGSIITGLRSLGQGMPDWPECASEELNKVSRYYRVDLASPDGHIRERSTLVFHGTFDQERVTACLRQVLSAFGVGDGMKGGVNTTGELTEIAMGDDRSYILWAKAGGDAMAVNDDDEAVVSSFLSNPNKLSPDGVLVGRIVGVDRTQDIWAVGTTDYAFNVLGEKSSGYDVALSFLGEMTPGSPDFGVRGQAHLHFASEAAAGKAKAGLDKFIDSVTEEDSTAEPSLTGKTGDPLPPVREVLDKVLTVTVDGSRLQMRFSVDNDQIMVLMGNMAVVLQRIQGLQ